MADDPNGSIKKAHAKTNLYFWPCDGDVTQASRWQESNCTLARLLANHRRVLGKAISVAVEIRRGIDDLVPSMAALCHRTCRFCPEPCCISNTVWFDLRDLLLFHLLKDPIPVGQAVSEPGVPCPFLSHNGCRLPPRIRPWMCFQYICPTQRAVLKKRGRPMETALLGMIKKIDKTRIRMEAEVIRRIKRRIRTSPSSSPASSG
ncbi:MAG: hypothetical protein HGJ94_14630 [Desulfosarcina sp.]|nr:hypothetical protein [Desulfosarcina sp.]